MLRIATLLLAGLLTSACAMTRELEDFEAFVPSQGTRHPVAVELHLAPDLATKVVRVEIGDDFDAHIGPKLVRDAEATVRAAFQEVHVTGGPASAAAGNSGTLALRFIGSATEIPSLYAFSEACTSVDLEWTLADRNGVTLWLATIRGEGRANAGNAFNAAGKAEKRFQLALDDAFARSLESLRTAAEIRAWVTGGAAGG